MVEIQPPFAECAIYRHSDTIDRFTPTKVEGLSDVDVVAVSLGDEYSAAITSKGDLYVWGYNCYGKLGVGDRIGRATPTKVPGLENVVAVSLGHEHSAAVTIDGDLYTWGNNDMQIHTVIESSGVLGLGNDTLSRYSPEFVMSGIKTR